METLAKFFSNYGQIDVTTVGEIEKAGGTITLDDRLNLSKGKNSMNHATVEGFTAEQLEQLFTPTQKNPGKAKEGTTHGCPTSTS